MPKGLAVGVKKANVVSSIEVISKSVKSTTLKKRVTLKRKSIGEISGCSPYERKIIELL